MIAKIHVCYQLTDPVTGERFEAVQGIDQVVLDAHIDQEYFLFGIYQGLRDKCERDLDASRRAGPKGKLP